MQKSYFDIFVLVILDKTAEIKCCQ